MSIESGINVSISKIFNFVIKLLFVAEKVSLLFICPKGSQLNLLYIKPEFKLLGELYV